MAGEISRSDKPRCFFQVGSQTSYSSSSKSGILGRMGVTSNVAPSLASQAPEKLVAMLQAILGDPFCHHPSITIAGDYQTWRGYCWICGVLVQWTSLVAMGSAKDRIHLPSFLLHASLPSPVSAAELLMFDSLISAKFFPNGIWCLCQSPFETLNCMKASEFGVSRIGGFLYYVQVISNFLFEFNQFCCWYPPV